MFWGWIGPDSIDKLVVCQGILNGKKYVSLLGKNLMDSSKVIYGHKLIPYMFGQDNVLPHTTKISRNPSFGIVTMFFHAMAWPRGGLGWMCPSQFYQK